jgi:hypothetical protein
MRPESTNPKLAVCLYGALNNSVPNIKNQCLILFGKTYELLYFENFEDTDLYKNLWFANFKKRQYEIENNSEFDVCLALGTNQMVLSHILRIPETLREKLYFAKGEYFSRVASTAISPSIFFSNSLIFDVVCNFGLVYKSLPPGRKSKLLEEDFYYFLKTLKIETECINYENRSLFKRTT